MPRPWVPSIDTRGALAARALKIALPLRLDVESSQPGIFFFNFTTLTTTLHIICMCKWSPEKRLYYYNS